MTQWFVFWLTAEVPDTPVGLGGCAQAYMHEIGEFAIEAARDGGVY